MNQTNDQVQTNQQNNIPAGQAVSSQKERETASVATEVLQPLSTEVELPKEVEKAGVTFQRETVEIPPDVQKLGVQHAGPTTPVANMPVLPQVVLPISDQQVVAGLHVHITNALLWLAIWCIKRLKKAHLALKNIHGEIIRVRI